MNRTLPLSALAVSLLLVNAVQAATNAGAELRRLQDEPRENLRTQPQTRRD